MSGLTYIMKSVGDSTDPCLRPRTSFSPLEVVVPMIMYSSQCVYVLIIAFHSLPRIPACHNCDHSTSLLTLLYALFKSIWAMYSGWFAFLLSLMIVSLVIIARCELCFFLDPD